MSDLTTDSLRQAQNFIEKYGNILRHLPDVSRMANLVARIPSEEVLRTANLILELQRTLPKWPVDLLTIQNRMGEPFTSDEDTISSSLVERLSKRDPDEHYLLKQPEHELTIPETRIAILPYSPILAWLEKLLYGEIKYNAKDWRQFEEAIAELLRKDKYDVKLGPGRKDGGQDLIATKEDPVLGFIVSAWQAKMLAPGNKIDVRIVRELVGSCILDGAKATKGIVVTTTYLTRDAFGLVEQERHFLGKRDRDDLLLWIEQVKKRR